MRRSISTILAVLALLLTAATASAVEPGVHVDPGSPSGKEYALPFDQARHGAGGPPSAQHPGGGGGANQAPGASDPRFGQGITPARSGRTPGTTGSGGAQQPSRSSAAVGARSGRSPSRAPSRTAPRSRTGGAGSSTPLPARAGLPTPGGSSSSGWVLGGTAAVVLLGGALALALRRRGPGRLRLDRAS